MRPIHIWWVFLWSHHFTLAQYPTASFLLPEQPYGICRGEMAAVQSNSTGAASLLWDFCPETFTEMPVISAPLPISGLTNGWGYKIVRDGNEWIGFLAGRNTNNLFRLEFGTNPNSNPTITNLGNPGNLLISPQGMDIVRHNGNWHLFLGKGETTTGQIVRLDFGSDLRSAPVAIGLGTFGVTGKRLRDVKIVKQESDLILLFVVDSDNAIRRVNYRDSFDNPVNFEHISSTGPLPGANLPLGFSVIRAEGNWIIHTVSFSNHGIQQYNFGNNILSSPLAEGNFTFASVNRPYYIKVIREGNTYFAIVGNESLKLAIINFGDLTGAEPPTELPNTSLQSLVNFDAIKYNSRNIIQGTITGTLNFSQIVFENVECPVSKSWDTNEIPLNVFWSNSGTGVVELEVTTSDYLIDVTSEAITITSDQVGLVEILNDNSCVSSQISFSTASDQLLTDWQWNFGDNTTSSMTNPVHEYGAAATYYVQVAVEDINSCKTIATKQLSIYSEPVANFVLPNNNPICTNQSYEIANTSTFDDGSQPSWQWFVNNVFVGSDEDTQYSFTSTTTQDIKLIASIPGCESEVIKTISSLVEGPLVDFTFSGHCEDESILFANNTAGTISGYAWDFDDGQQSTDINPEHIFLNQGVYNVTLRASNAAGCNNTSTKTVTIYSKPQVSFNVSLPPFSCSGTPTMFTNLTPNPSDSNIDSWAWDFGDPASGQNTSALKNPQHTYANAGTYDVLLTATTNFDCSSTIQLPVVISETPPVDFTHTATCEDVAISFSGTSSASVQAWDWQIGSSFYSTQNPTHTFTNPISTSAVLTITGTNNCINFVTKPIVVPGKLIPDFTFSKNCVDQQTLFTDATNGIPDPITSAAWDFDGLGTATGSPTEFIFTTTGTRNITLVLITQTGCEYFIAKPVNIGESPQASFTVSPDEGVQPLLVQFTNTSLGATSYHWNFDDSENTTSTAVSPSFTYQDAGEYDVTLIAYNSLNCSDTSHHQIFVEAITSVEDDRSFYCKAPHPNPTQGDLFLQWSDYHAGELVVTVLDNIGRPVLKSTVSSFAGENETSLNVRQLPVGVYFLQMRLENRKKIFRIVVTSE